MTKPSHAFGNHVIEVTHVNGLEGDPATYVYLPRVGEAILFDIGVINALPARKILKTKIICVSHTHLDHFIGFDTLLRVSIPHFRTYEVIGPPGIAKNVSSKLQGYLWNLLEPDQVGFIVHEVGQDGGYSTFKISSTNGFILQLLAEHPPSSSDEVAKVGKLGDGTVINAMVLDHGTPSLGYAVEVPPRFQILRDKLADLGLEPGPWLRELQLALAAGRRDETIRYKNQVYTAGALGDAVTAPLPLQVLGYLTDIGFTSDNLNRIGKLLQNVEILTCETNYRDQDVAKARQRSHLTTKQAALIACMVGAKELRPFHISNLYLDDIPAAYEEAQGFFKKFKGLAPNDLEAEITAELSRINGLS